MTKCCFSFNDLALYREAIYLLMDKEFDADWYIEDIDTHCKEFDKNKIKHLNYLHTIEVGPIVWIKGYLSLLWKDYDVYLLLGQSNNLSLYMLIFFKRLFKRRKKVFLWAHGWYGKETKMQCIIKKWLFSHVDGTFVYGDYARRLMIDHGIDGRKIWPIHNSLNYEEQLLLRNQLSTTSIYKNHFGNDNPVLIMIGRLTLRKQLDLLLKAVAYLKEMDDYFNIVVVGDGEDKEKLITLASSLDIDNQVWFYGACYDERTNAELLTNADMCVVPGDIGLTAIHSLMFGVPVITHDNFKLQGPEFETIKVGETGEYYQYGSVKDLANRISNWFKNHKGQREIIRSSCYDVIDSQWNPNYQISVLLNKLK